MLRAYTDGGTHKTNPGPMAWAVVYVENDQVIREEVGALYQGTNNKAELLGVIWALERETDQDVEIYTDSTVTLKIATGVWTARQNLDLWDRFWKAVLKRNFRGLSTYFYYVKGHSNDPYNQRADQLTRSAAQNASKCLRETSCHSGNLVAKAPGTTE